MPADTFYVTTPIYYVNDKPHIGHAYTTILADVLARYHRLLGRPTWFLTGTDEHGQKVQQAATRNRITPQEQCDRTVVRFQALWKKLEITNDDFIRTSEIRHKTVVQKILQDLHDRGEIYADSYEGWYCVPCERFFPEKDLTGGHCPECNRPVDRLSEKNYFFRMGKYQRWLVEHIESHPEFIQPAHRRQETLGFLRKPLGDLCISRPKTRLNWGIDLPFDSQYVTYVWFDALVNYISAIGYPHDLQTFRRWWPVSCHLIGKDILTTHTVYWPTMLKAIGVEMPVTVFAHGWWLVGQSKMSKSLGNVVDPMGMAETYGVDAFRYFLMAEMSLGQDASFTEDGFIRRYNADLANELGNMASRVLKMAHRFLGGSLKAPQAPGPAEEQLAAAALGAVRQMEHSLGAMQLDRGLAEVQRAIREGNRYFEQMAPWNLAKRGDSAGLERVVYSAAECLRIVSGLLFPVMPGKMAELRSALGVPAEALEPRLADLAAWGNLPIGRPMHDIPPLFPRVEMGAGASSADRGVTVGKVEGGGLSPPQSSAAPTVAAAPTGLIDIATLGKVQLKTARVLHAERVEGSAKLLKLQVEIGTERRQVVAGFAKFYSPETLVGRTTVIVANLKPVMLFGIESNGMLLAAKAGDCLRLITVDGDLPSGAEVG